MSARRQQGHARGGGSDASGGASKEKVKGFFRKFNDQRDRHGQQGGSGGGGPAGFVTQNQQNIAVTTSPRDISAGRNFSPVNAADYEPLLPPPLSHLASRHMLLLDIDETLVHSSFKPVKADLVLPIEIDGTTYQVYVKKRPYLHEFLKRVGEIFEVAAFTASLSKYANPLMDTLDPGQKMLGGLRLFREHCSHTNGAYVKDLSLLGRELHRMCIIDNSPVAYLFQPRNALPCTSYFDDTNPPNDSELRDFLPLLERMATAATVYDVLDEYHQQLGLLDQ